MSTKVGDIFVRANLDRTQYDKGLQTMQATTSKIAGKMGAVFAATVGAAAAAGMIKLTKSAADLGDQIDKMSQKLGLSSAAYQEWDYIMERCGASIDSMTVAMKTLATSAETGKDALAELGISQAQLTQMSQEDAFGLVIQRLQGVENQTRRTYLAGQLLGRGATELGALLNMSAQETEVLRQRLGYLGGYMSQTAVSNAAAFKDALTDLRMSFRGIYNAIATYVLPALTTAINYVLAFWRVVRQAFATAFAPIKKGAELVRGAMGKTFGKDAQKDVKNAGNAIGGVGSGLKGAGGNAKKAKKEVQALKRELLGFDKITKLTKQDSATGTGGAGGVGGGGLDYSGMEADASNFADTINGYFDSIKIPPALEKAIKGLGEAFSMLWERLKSAGQFCYENILKPIGKWFAETWLPKAIETVSAGIRVFCAAWDLLLAVLKPLWEPLLKPCLEGLGKLLGKTLTTPMDLVTTSLNLLTAGLKLATEWVEKFYKWAGNIKISLKDEFTNTWNSIKSKWDEKVTSVKTLAVNIQDNAKAQWENVKKWWNGASLKAKTVTVDLVNKAKSAWSTFQTWWNKLKAGAKTFTVNFKFADKLRSGWNSLAGKINKARSKSSVVKALIPNIPYLAQGGYLPANTPRLAVVGDNKREGEIVAPESKLQAMADAAANRNTDEVVKLLTALLKIVSAIDTNVYLDGEQIKNNVVTRINNHTRATGQLEIIM